MARIDSIALTNGTFVRLGFNTVSNWNYALQAADGMNDVASGFWSNLFTVPAQTPSGHVEYLDGLTNRERLYRLDLTP